MIKEKIVIVITVALISLLIAIPMLAKHKKPAQQATIVTGLTTGQQKTFQQDLSGALKQYGHIKKGDKLLSEGKFDDAVKEYKTALSLARSIGSKGEAFRSLADLYEKKREYKKALVYMRLEEQTYVADWAKPPIFERIKYLEYASNGDYELAVQHAQMAIEADKNLPDSKGKVSPDYIDRLNDLKSAESYIRSIKSGERSLFTK